MLWKSLKTSCNFVRFGIPIEISIKVTTQLCLTIVMPVVFKFTTQTWFLTGYQFKHNLDFVCNMYYSWNNILNTVDIKNLYEYMNILIGWLIVDFDVNNNNTQLANTLLIYSMFEFYCNVKYALFCTRPLWISCLEH